MDESIHLRLNESQSLFLQSIAKDNDLFKKGDELSSAKAIKFLLNYCMKNDIKADGANGNIEGSNVEKMLEQLCISIPHVLQTSFIASQASLVQLDKKNASIIKEDSIKYIANTCGQMQQLDYKNSFVSYNHRSMKTLPIDEDKNEWK